MRFSRYDVRMIIILILYKTRMSVIYEDPGSHLLFHAVASIVPSAVWVLTIVFGMGTGVSPKRITAGNS